MHAFRFCSPPPSATLLGWSNLLIDGGTSDDATVKFQKCTGHTFAHFEAVTMDPPKEESWPIATEVKKQTYDYDICCNYSHALD